MITSTYAAELTAAKAIAKKAGKIMLQYFDGNQQETAKADGSALTIADTKINRLVIEELAKTTSDGLIGEEESTAGYGMGRRWLCDPIDGTKPYTLGVPTSMFSLALVVDGRPVLGVAYNPFIDRLFTGVEGEGSYCNGRPVRVKPAGLADGYVAITSSTGKLIGQSGYAERLIDRGANLVSISGAVFKSCSVASGRIIGYIGRYVNAYDMAAAHVIIKGAGGKITGLDGKELDYSKPFKGAIVSNGRIHADLVECWTGGQSNP